jgi:predicted Zn-ribbon and HTH transcriptional regulator
MVYVHKCLRCGWDWASRNSHPVRCPKCKTPYWDKERRIAKRVSDGQ